VIPGFIVSQITQITQINGWDDGWIKKIVKKEIAWWVDTMASAS
jgi:hypothetical protein